MGITSRLSFQGGAQRLQGHKLPKQRRPGKSGIHGTAAARFAYETRQHNRLVTLWVEATEPSAPQLRLRGVSFLSKQQQHNAATIQGRISTNEMRPDL